MGKIEFVVTAITFLALPIAYYQIKGSNKSTKEIISEGKKNTKHLEKLIIGSSEETEIDLGDSKNTAIAEESQEYLSTNVELFDKFAEDICNAEHGPNRVKFDRGYIFSQNMSNRSESDIFLHKFKIKYINPNRIDSGRKWRWTRNIKDENYSLGPGQSIKYLETAAPWRISGKPSELEWDFGIVTTVWYDDANDSLNEATWSKFISCIRYKIVID